MIRTAIEQDLDSVLKIEGLSFSMDSKASTFYAMELQMNKRNTFALRSPLIENPKHNLNGILPPFEIEGRAWGCLG